MGIALFSCTKDPETTENCSYTGFYYYQNAPYDIGEINSNYLSIGFDSAIANQEITAFILDHCDLDTTSVHEIATDNFTGIKYVVAQVTKTRKTKSCDRLEKLMEDVEMDPIIRYVHFTTETNQCSNLIFQPIGEECVKTYAPYFTVSLTDTSDFPVLDSLVNATNTKIIDQNRISPEVYLILADKYSSGDASAMGNYFHETGFFNYSQPNYYTTPVVPLE